MLEDEDNLDSYDIGKPLTNKARQGKIQNLKIIIFLVTLNLILIGLVTFGIINLYDDENDNKIFVLKHDKEFIKPAIKMNLEFELVKLENNMTGLIINDPNSITMHAQFHVDNGHFTDTIGGIAHLAEHMLFAGSQKYKKLYPYDRTFASTKNFILNGLTGGELQAYFVSIYNNYKYQKTIDIMIDSFRHPLYDKEIIEKEIQAINSEFYLNYRHQYFLMEDIIRQLSNPETTFNRLGCGNNETLNPKESHNISKKLKQYHMIINRPEKIFFVFYSNLSIKKSEKYIKDNFNYKMYEFPENEIDKDYKKEFEENLNKFKNNEIFDDNLYKHGIFYNSNNKLNILNIFFHIGKVDYKDIQFDLLEYYYFLFNSKSLLTLLKEKEYIISTDRIGVYTFTLIENNNVMDIELALSDKGLKDLNEVLVIIYKYIGIMKKEGAKRELFENFVKYKENLNIINFKKDLFTQRLLDNFISLNQNYRIYGENQIFTTGTPNITLFNEEKLQNYLNNIKYEKSFFILNLKPDISTIISAPPFIINSEEKNIKYYNAEVLYGEFPDDFTDSINKNKENIKIRSINPYFSDDLLLKDPPCYKISHKKCDETNEFDFEKSYNYTPSKLKEENNNYVTEYQIDKSSESNIASAYLEFTFQENEIFKAKAFIRIESDYLNKRIIELDETNSIYITNFYNTTLGIEFRCFKDNIEKIMKDFINLIIAVPQEVQFKYIVDSILGEFNYGETNLFSYTLTTSDLFYNKGEMPYYGTSVETMKEMFLNATFEDFKKNHSEIYNTVKSMKLKVAGNINKELVQNLHNIIKETIKIPPQNFKIFKEAEPELEKKDESYVINYYEKSNLTSEIDNAVFVRYEFNETYRDYMQVFMGCLQNIAMIYLRFNYSNAYTPRVLYYYDSIGIYEQGRYKEVTDMEEDIDKVIYGMMNNTIQCENYKEIVDSYKITADIKHEKSYDTLVSRFFYEYDFEDRRSEEKEISFPKNFKDFMKFLSPIFTNPKRIAVLMARSDMSDEDFEEMVENKKMNTNEKYILNNSIIIENTDDIYYLNKTRKE